MATTEKLSFLTCVSDMMGQSGSWPMYGNMIASCGYDRKVIISYLCFRHDGHVWQLAWAHPMYGNMIASCGYDRKVIISYLCFRHDGPVWQLAYVW